MLISYCRYQKSYTFRTDKEFVLVVKYYSVNRDETQIDSVYEISDTPAI